MTPEQLAQYEAALRDIRESYRELAATNRTVMQRTRLSSKASGIQIALDELHRILKGVAAS